ncbi:MAG TPA: hypothetical protein ENJ09_12950 [Planctomycetes bacterium]|nr:hypothetical protein [Planctomycetota bacterium]
MIVINLLPEEYRQKKRAPLKFLLATAAVVAVNASLLAVWAWTSYGVATEVESELALLKDTEAGLQPQVAYHDALEAESKLFESREGTLKKITEARVSWTEQIDDLVDLINRGGDGDKYLIWLDGLTVDTRENSRAGTYGDLKATAHSGTASITHVANFLEDVEHSPLSRNFLPPVPPKGTAVTKDEGLMPAEIWNFPLEMSLKAPKDRERD